MKCVIEFQKVTKKYVETTALSDVSLCIERNKVYGLLGRNGAGKSTLLHILTAQVLPSGGRVLVNGKSPFENAAVLRDICFIQENKAYLKNMKLKEILTLCSGLYTLWDSNYALELMSLFDLNPEKRVRNMSRGMHSALGLIIGLASQAPVTVFDEPSLGLDAASRVTFYNALLEDYAKRPRTIIIATHIISEVSNLLEEVIIIDRGRIVLKAGTETIAQNYNYLSGEQELLEKYVQGKKILHRVSLGNTLVVAVGDCMPDDLREEILSSGIKISAVPLQDVVIYLTSGSKKGGN